MPNVFTTEEPAKVREVSKRYPTRIRSATKRLIKELQLLRIELKV